MKNCTICTKLILAFSFISLIVAVLGITGYLGTKRNLEYLTDIAAVRSPSIEQLLRIQEAMQDIRGSLCTLVIPGLSLEIKERQLANLDKAQEKWQKAWKIYEPLPQTKEEAEEWQKFIPLWNDYIKEKDEALKLFKQVAETGVDNPKELEKLIEKFTKDHYILSENVLLAIHHGVPFEGGEDHTLCNFGKWLGSTRMNNKELDRLLREMGEHHKNFHKNVKEIKALLAAGKVNEAKELYTKEMQHNREEVFKFFAQLKKEAEDIHLVFSKMEEKLLGSLTEKQVAARASLEKLVKINNDVQEQAEAFALKLGNAMKQAMLFLMVIGIIGVLLFSFFITRSINRALLNISNTLQSGAEQVAAAATQVAQASQHLAEGVSQEASSLEETSATLEEMSSMIRQNSDNAHQADIVSKETKEAADQGAEAMKRMEEAINTISSSAAETAKIIKTIDEIAFQTNLLALNAAVEAARAGEAGKGFAVVAEEVRNLARRAAEAARDTALLIEQSQKNAESGVNVVKDVNLHFGTIKDKSEKLATLISEIATASREQTQGIDQINTAVSSMDQVLQSTAANAEESASAAEELQGQARELQEMVAQLLSMVKGAQAVAEMRSKAMATSRAKQAGASAQKQQQKPSQKAVAVHKSGDEKTTKEQAISKKPVKPEEVIPLDEKELTNF